MSEQVKYQPRWVQYCRVHRKPLDCKEPNLPFMLWIQSKWREWAAEKGLPAKALHHITAEMHREFDAWLEKLPEERDGNG
ncbi:MAG: hypothetical protein ACM3ZC_13335 [Bacteroidota bacterium]